MPDESDPSAGAGGTGEPTVKLRPLEEGDFDELSRLAYDPEAIGVHEWQGFRDPKLWRKRWEADGYISDQHTWLAVEDGEGTFVGIVSWRDHVYAGQPGVEYDIGALMLRQHRGRGLGTAAQRALVAHLFATQPVHRLAAYTEADNVGEQRALEKVGFVQEGRLRELVFRGGAWRDHLVYGLLRADLPENAHDSGGSA
jgi:RimJ/RimL family protein N-acetyltransferase